MQNRSPENKILYLMTLLAPAMPQQPDRVTVTCWFFLSPNISLPKRCASAAAGTGSDAGADAVSSRMQAFVRRFDSYLAFHSITKTACFTMDSGMVTPRAFAVLRLTAMSNNFGPSTGRSPGLA